MLKIDEILLSLQWTNDPDVIKKGIADAENVNNILVFFQPNVIVNGIHLNKNIWENCARILANRSVAELMPYRSLMDEWIEDPNWPGAEIMKAKIDSFCSGEDFSNLIEQEKLPVDIDLCIEMLNRNQPLATQEHGMLLASKICSFGCLYSLDYFTYLDEIKENLLKILCSQDDAHLENYLSYFMIHIDVVPDEILNRISKIKDPELFERSISTQILISPENKLIKPSKRILQLLEMRKTCANLSKLEKEIRWGLELASTSTGKTIVPLEEFQFGSIPGNNTEKKSISWIILREDSDVITALCKDALCLGAYHEKKEVIQWEQSDLKYWLEHNFKQAFFSDTERSKLLRISLLSVSDCMKYCPTDYRKAKMQLSEIRRIWPWYVGSDQNWPWWLEGPHWMSDSVPVVEIDGTISLRGKCVNDKSISIRPVIQIQKE